MLGGRYAGLPHGCGQPGAITVYLVSEIARIVIHHPGGGRPGPGRLVLTDHTAGRVRPCRVRIPLSLGSSGHGGHGSGGLPSPSAHCVRTAREPANSACLEWPPGWSVAFARPGGRPELTDGGGILPRVTTPRGGRDGRPCRQRLPGCGPAGRRRRLHREPVRSHVSRPRLPPGSVTVPAGATARGTVTLPEPAAALRAARALDRALACARIDHIRHACGPGCPGMRSGPRWTSAHSPRTLARP